MTYAGNRFAKLAFVCLAAFLFAPLGAGCSTATLPDIPDVPDVTDDVDDTDVPDDPGDTDDPGTPDVPDEPDEPVVPDVPDVPDDAEPPVEDDIGTVTVTLQADFGEGGEVGPAAAKDPCPDAVPTMDDPRYESGLDCDVDGGAVRFITPSSYKIAVKRLAFENESGELIDIVPDTGTLASAVVVDLTNPVTLPALPLPFGVYTSYYAELYYHQLTMPLYDPADPQTIRVYVSDDDFPTEGNLGHHQGDITMLDGSGTEMGFVGAGEFWQAEFLQTPRGEINGAGGVDPETGHLRGLYGDTSQWNRPDAMQGPGQDIYILAGELFLTLGEGGGAITFVFDVQDTWFFEDFDGDQLFNPCANGNQDGCGGEWSPLFNQPEVIVE